MEQDKDYMVIICALLFVFAVMGCAYLFSHQQEQINEQQKQIDKLIKENHVQDLRLKILEQI